MMFDSCSFKKKSSFVCDFDGDQTHGLTLTQFCTHIFRREISAEFVDRLYCFKRFKVAATFNI